MDTIPVDLEKLLNPTPSAYVLKSEVPEMRAKMLRDAACSLGVRGGLNWRSQDIRRSLELSSGSLDKFSFQSFVTADGMLPPVVTEQQDVVKQDDSLSKRSAGVIYRMIQPARLVMQTPTWRDYLYVGLADLSGRIEMPHESLLPVSDGEKTVWRAAVQECWSTGVAQADVVFEENLNRLKRDYAGMIRYRMLLANGMADQIVVASETRPVAGDSQEMAIDSRTVSITRSGALQPDQSKWK